MAQGGGNPQLQEFYFGQAFGVPGRLQTREQFEGLRAAAGRPGGIAGELRRTGDVSEQDRIEAERVTRALQTRGGQILTREAAIATLAESGAVKSLEDIRTNFLTATGNFAESLKDSTTLVEGLSKALKDLIGDTAEVGGVFQFLARLFPNAGAMPLFGGDQPVPGLEEEPPPRSGPSIGTGVTPPGLRRQPRQMQ